MRSCWSTSLLIIVTVAGPAPAHASAPAPVPPPGAPAPATVVHYGFNAHQPDAIIDESGNGHTLQVVSFRGGQVRPVVHGPGTALAFPGKCTRTVCPHVALQSDDSADLNPGNRDISFGADVLLAPGQTSTGQNVLQKGYSRTSSQYKLQIDGTAGHPSCVLVDERRAIRVARSAVSTADGRWHRIRCRRAGTTLEIYVDDVRHGWTQVPAGLSVSNNRPLSIGAKGAYRDNDQFNGVLDNVWVRIG